ncbi:MAG: hypothetical protein V7K27_27160 [Nostoc sp.]|uniref:hypothetical protein n=1 Tax=Nostoc sp. TaxID=1180 RepID=UPI002FF84317
MSNALSWQQEDTQGLSAVARIVLVHSSYLGDRIKKPPVGVSQPGELVIRVHLPIKCSQVEHHNPDKFVQSSVIFLNKKPQWVLANQGSELSGCIYQ